MRWSPTCKSVSTIIFSISASAYFDRTHSSLLIAGLSQRAGSASSVMSTVLTSFVRDLLSVVGLLAVMIIKSPWMSLIVIMVAPLALFGIGKLVARTRSIARAEFAGMTQIIASMQETATGVRVVKAFNLECAMRARMNQALRVFSDAATRLRRSRPGPRR